MTKATVIGHGPDGQRVVLWEEDHPWMTEPVPFLEFGPGSEWLRLDHVEPDLVRVLRASLTPAPEVRAA